MALFWRRFGHILPLSFYFPTPKPCDAPPRPPWPAPATWMTPRGLLIWPLVLCPIPVGLLSLVPFFFSLLFFFFYFEILFLIFCFFSCLPSWPPFLFILLFLFLHASFGVLVINKQCWPTSVIASWFSPSIPPSILPLSSVILSFQLLFPLPPSLSLFIHPAILPSTISPPSIDLSPSSLHFSSSFPSSLYIHL